MRVTWGDGVICGESEARISTDAMRALGQGAAPLLVDIRGLKRMERGAREHFKAENSASIIAMLVDSPVTKMLANFFLATYRGSNPTRMFTDEPAALKWLQDNRP